MSFFRMRIPQIHSGLQSYVAVAPACATNARLSVITALVRDRICLTGWEPSKLLLTGGGDYEEREEILIAWH